MKARNVAELLYPCEKKRNNSAPSTTALYSDISGQVSPVTKHSPPQHRQPELKHSPIQPPSHPTPHITRECFIYMARAAVYSPTEVLYKYGIKKNPVPVVLPELYTIFIRVEFQLVGYLSRYVGIFNIAILVPGRSPLIMPGGWGFVGHRSEYGETRQLGVFSTL